MSGKIAGKVWDLRGIPSTIKYVIVKLADNANDQGVCWPSIKEIASDCEMSVRTIQGAIKWAIEASLITVERRDGKRTIYKLTPAEYAPPQDMRPADKSNSPPQITTSTPADYDIDTYIEPSIVEPSKEPSIQNNEKPKPENKNVRKKRVCLPATYIDDNFQPDIESLAECSRLGVDADPREFIDYWKGVGKPMCDWQATFRNNARRVARNRKEREQRSSNGRQGTRDVVGAALRAAEVLRQREN